MEGVERVTQLDDKCLHLVAEIAGASEEWYAEIVDQEPDRRVSWRAVTGPKNEGVVGFQPLGPSSTRVRLHLEMEPEGKRFGEFGSYVGHRVGITADGDWILFVGRE